MLESCSYGFVSTDTVGRYYSGTHGSWLDAKILAVDEKGQVEINLKPGWSPGEGNFGLLREVPFWTCSVFLSSFGLETAPPTGQDLQ